MPANLQPVGLGAKMVGVVDRPAGEPKNLLFELLEGLEIARIGHQETDPI